MISRDIFETGSGLQLVVDKTSENECTFILTKCGVLLHTDTLQINPTAEKLDNIVTILGAMTGANVDVDEDYFYDYTQALEDWRLSSEANNIVNKVIQYTNNWWLGDKETAKKYFEQRTKFL